MAQIKYNLGTVGGMAVTELWSGSVGNLTGVVIGAKITLNDDITNYKFLVFDFYCYLSGLAIRWYYSRVVPVKQFINLFNNTDTTETFIGTACGYGNLTDYFIIIRDSTTKVLNVNSNYTQCVRIVGIN